VEAALETVRNAAVGGTRREAMDEDVPAADSGSGAEGRP